MILEATGWVAQPREPVKQVQGPVLVGTTDGGAGRELVMKVRVRKRQGSQMPQEPGEQSQRGRALSQMLLQSTGEIKVEDVHHSRFTRKVAGTKLTKSLCLWRKI